MKKGFVMAVCALVGALTLAGCGKDDNSTDISKVNVDKYITSIGDYKNMTLEVKEQVVTDEDVENGIQYLLSMSPELEEVKGRAAQTGDIANINFEGKKDGVAFEGGTSENYDIEIGSGAFIPGFEDGMIGMEIGETRDLELSFPEEYHVPELAGQDVVFTVKLNGLQQYKQIELNDEYVKGLGLADVNTVDEFKAEVRKQFEAEAQNTYESNMENAALEALLNICEFSDEVPSGRYTYYYDNLVKSDEEAAASYNSDIQTYATSYLGFESVDAYYNDLKEAAYRATRMDLATYKILELEGATFSDADVKNEIKEHYADFGFESVDDFNAQIDLVDYKMYLTNQKALEVIKQNAKVVAPAE